MKIKLILPFLIAYAAAGQTPTVSAVVNINFPTPSLSPGVLATVFGTNLGTDKTALTVTVGGKQGFVLFASATQVNVQLPVDAQPGATILVVTNAGAASAPFNVTLAAYAPALSPAQDGKTALLLNAAGAVATQVKPGDNVTAYAVGLGATNPPAATGVAAAGVSPCVTTPQLTLGGVAFAPPSFCGLVPNQVGLFQLNLKIPAVPAGTQPLVLTIGGISSPPLNVTVASAAAAPPTITNIANAASNIGYNSPIAAGAIFVLYGTGLGPANISIAPTPFQSTSLSGTSVAVTVGNTTVNALLYYTSATQVAALLPSNTPAGGANFTVTYNGQPSVAQAHGVGSSNVGIFTVDSSGQGAAIVTYPDYSLVSPVKASNCGGPNTTCGAANPGDTLILWGTGMGPVNGSDAAGAGLGQNMPSVPLTVWLGGVQAPVVYQGRSGCCIGEDQVVFTVPNNAPTGCAVPLTVQVGTTTSTISNTALIAVASGSRNCTAVNATLAKISATAFEQLATSGTPVGVVSLNLRRDPNDSGAGFVDSAKFQAFKVTAFTPGAEPFALSFLDDPPIGACVVYSNTNDNNDVPFTNAVDLDAGPSFALQGPNGSVTVPPAVVASGGRTTLSSTGAFVRPGSYTITGPGGKDVGAFTSNFSLAPVPAATGPANNATVTRADGMTVTWTPGTAGAMIIQVVSAADNTFNNGFTTQCSAPMTSGSFTIPAYALLPHFPGNLSYFQLFTSEHFPFTVSGAPVAATEVRRSGPSSPLVLK